MTTSIDFSSRRHRHTSAAALLVTLALAACTTAPVTPRPAPPVSQPDSPAPVILDKGDPQQRFDQAMSLWQQAQVAEAEAALVSLVEDFPDHTGPWTNLGILYARSNRRDQAIGALLKAVSLKSDNALALNWLGILYRETGDLGRARVAYERALDADPNYALAHYNLGILFDAHLKRPADALNHYREYLRLGHADDLKVLAWVAEIEASLPAEAAPVTDNHEATP